MHYTYHTLQDWNGDNARWPSQVYTERNEQGLETRKLILHTNGGISYATDGMSQGDCFLRPDVQSPEPDPGTPQAHSLTTLISQTEFEETWRALVLRIVP